MPAPLVDLSARLDDLCRDICAVVPQLGHIDPSRVLFTLVRSRAEGVHGTYARIVPLRFAGGAREWSRRRGALLETFRMPPLEHDGRDIRYVIALMIPRFLRLPLEQKLLTVLHELYHISPDCDGDIRRFAGRNFAHGRSRATYNTLVEGLLQHYRNNTEHPGPAHALDITETAWEQGRIHLVGLRLPLPRPRLVARRRL